MIFYAENKLRDMNAVVKNRMTHIELPKIIEYEADAKLSGIVASSNNGRLIELDRIPELILDSKFMDMVKKTQTYSKHGDAWFWIGTTGTEFDGHHKINSEGRTLGEKFIPIKQDSSMFGTRDCRQVALFLKGDGQLSVSIMSVFTFTRRDITVSGAFRSSMRAPLVVIDNVNNNGIRKMLRE